MRLNTTIKVGKEVLLQNKKQSYFESLNQVMCIRNNNTTIIKSALTFFNNCFNDIYYNNNSSANTMDKINIQFETSTLT